jgi:hypothetical protein
VQAQVNAASSGATVTITPADCSASWNGLSIPSSKFITLDGNGANIERSGSSGQAMTIAVNANGMTRVTNFKFSESSDTGFSPEAIIMITGCMFSASSPNASFRIDHSTFTSPDLGHIFVNCHGRGLADHNTHTYRGNNEIIHVWGSNDASWAEDITPGSADAMYFEDNTFRNTISGGFSGGKVAAFFGARVVYRFNTIDCTEIDIHGNTPRSGRWWELYQNNFVLGTCNNVDKWYQIRGGSGIIFGDTVESGNQGGGTLTFWQDGGKSPSGQDHVGLGRNQTQDPAYVWSTNAPQNEDDSACSNCIQANRDYFRQVGSFNGTTGVGVGPISSRPATCAAGSGGAPGVGYWATDEGEWWAAHPGADGRLYKCTSTNTWTLHFTPLTYPHPLTGNGSGSGDTMPPDSPKNLRVL